MLFEGWNFVEHEPYLMPHGFGASIFISCPLLLLLFRFRGGLQNRSLIVASWIAIVVLTLALWLHANPGGWQFSYRYGMITLALDLLILLNNGKNKTSEIGGGAFSDLRCH